MDLDQLSNLDTVILLELITDILGILWQRFRRARAAERSEPLEPDSGVQSFQHPYRIHCEFFTIDCTPGIP